MTVRAVVEFAELLRETVAWDDTMVTVDYEHSENGEFRELLVSGRDRTFRLKYGQGDLQNFR